MATTPRISASHLGDASANAARLPAPARAAVEDLLAQLDHELPSRIERFYVVGSTYAGAFREGRSDVDFVAILAGELEAFASEWRPLIEKALAFRRGAPASPPYRRHPGVRRRAVAAFVAHVIESANRLTSNGGLPRRHRPAPDTSARAG
ncbi:MAG TPA: hypothetical protein VEF89_33590 [Solirubrobacteraceae bacterium]|nr:hypothetical protein [Solirubrobacteraceae bacterium]